MDPQLVEELHVSPQRPWLAGDMVSLLERGSGATKLSKPLTHRSEQTSVVYGQPAECSWVWTKPHSLLFWSCCFTYLQGHCWGFDLQLVTQLLENGKGRLRLGSLPPSLLTSSLGTGQRTHPVCFGFRDGTLHGAVTSIHSTAGPGLQKGKMKQDFMWSYKA